MILAIKPIAIIFCAVVAVVGFIILWELIVNLLFQVIGDLYERLVKTK